MTPKDPNKLKAKIAAGSTHLVANKMVIFDCLLQCREDYMASAEEAVKRHRHLQADNQMNDALKRDMLNDASQTITKCMARLTQINKAMQELT